MNLAYYQRSNIDAAFRDFLMPSTIPTASVKGAWRRFGRNRRGSAAVEFALVAPAFFALLFAIIETGIVFFAGQVLETATQDAARAVMTGQAQSQGLSQSQFKASDVCNVGSVANVLFNCNNISVDVESFKSFANINLSPLVDANGNLAPTQYSPGQACDIVVVRLAYEWQLYVTGLGYNIASLPGGKRLLGGTAAFQNEPYNGQCP
jgi:Flp pilus assembly protein TadG